MMQRTSSCARRPACGKALLEHSHVENGELARMTIADIDPDALGGQAGRVLTWARSVAEGHVLVGSRATQQE